MGPSARANGDRRCRPKVKEKESGQLAILKSRQRLCLRRKMVFVFGSSSHTQKKQQGKQASLLTIHKISSILIGANFLRPTCNKAHGGYGIR